MPEGGRLVYRGADGACFLVGTQAKLDDFRRKFHAAASFFVVLTAARLHSFHLAKPPSEKIRYQEGRG
jgi:hypothetical protein